MKNSNGCKYFAFAYSFETCEIEIGKNTEITVKSTKFVYSKVLLNRKLHTYMIFIYSQEEAALTFYINARHTSAFTFDIPF